MLSISVTGADNEEGRQELRKFHKFLNTAFIITQKSSAKFTKIDYDKGKYLNTNRTTRAQQQSNLIHQANEFQGVNLIYAVDTNNR